MDYLSILKTFPLLSVITDGELSVFCERLTEHKIPAGENIITEGDMGSEMYILIEGTVDIIKTTLYGERFVVCALEASFHCVFGEMAMIDSDKRSGTVRAKTD